MKVFTDATETAFFKTDKYIKNLHVIEINSIEEFVFRYSLDPMILLGVNSWMIRRFDELISGNPVIDSSDEPALHGEWLDIDFVEDMELLDILVEVTKYITIDDTFLEDIKKAGLFSEIKKEWINDGEDQKWTITNFKGSRKLCIVIDADDELTCYFDHEKIDSA